MRFAVWPDVTLGLFWLVVGVASALSTESIARWIYALACVTIAVKCWESFSLKRLCSVKQDLIETQREYYTMLEEEIR